MRPGRLAWAEKDDAMLQEHFARGLTYKRIGELMGRSPSGCQQRAFNLGLKRGARNQHMPIKFAPQNLEGELPTVAYVPGIIVTGRYQMAAPLRLI